MTGARAMLQLPWDHPIPARPGLTDALISKTLDFNSNLVFSHRDSLNPSSHLCGGVWELPANTNPLGSRAGREVINGFINESFISAFMNEVFYEWDVLGQIFMNGMSVTGL